MPVLSLPRSVRLSDGSVLPAGTRYKVLEVLGDEGVDPEMGLAAAGSVVLLVDSGQRVFLSQEDLLGIRTAGKRRQATPAPSRDRAFLQRARTLAANHAASLVRMLDEEGVAPATEPLSQVRRRHR